MEFGSIGHKMTPRWITAILWTLVSVNSLTLVLGGLITWLGYAIPIRLKQFGLAPQLAQIAGLAALLVACLGLCALNYSSHYALNVYGLSCAILAVLMLFGAMPEDWSNEQRAAAAAAHQQRQAKAAKSFSLAVPQLENSSLALLGANLGGSSGANSSSAASSAAGSVSASVPVASGAAVPQAEARSPVGAGGTGGILLDLIYFFLLTLLASLLLSALAMAQYLRRKEAEQTGYGGGSAGDQDHREEDSEREWRRAIGAAAGSPVCTCGASVALPAAAIGQLLYRGQQQALDFNGAEQYHRQSSHCIPLLAQHAGHDQSLYKQEVNNCYHQQSDTFDARLCSPSHHEGWLPMPRLHQAGQRSSLAARRKQRSQLSSSMSLSQSAIQEFVATADRQQQQHNRYNERMNSYLDDQRLVGNTVEKPLVHRGVYHANGANQDKSQQSPGNNGGINKKQKCLKELGAFELALDADQIVAAVNDDDAISVPVNKTDAKDQSRRAGELECRCNMLAAPDSNQTRWLAGCDPESLLTNQVSWPPLYYCTMPKNLSSVYEIKSAFGSKQMRRQMRQQQQQSDRSNKLYGGRSKFLYQTSETPVVAMTAAAAAAALLGNVVDSSMLDGVGGGGDSGILDCGAAETTNFDDELVMGNHAALDCDAMGEHLLVPEQDHNLQQIEGQSCVTTNTIYDNLPQQSNSDQLYAT